MTRQQFKMLLIVNFIIDVAVWFQGDYWIMTSNDPKAGTFYILIPCVWIVVFGLTYVPYDHYLSLKVKR